MELEIRPEPTEAEREAIATALARVEPDGVPAAYRSPWRLAALAEAAQADDARP